jgi:hypothetical protein
MIMQCAVKMGIKATRRALADALKEECAAMLATQLEESVRTANDILAEMHQDGTKEKYRLLLQFWGTEFKRGMVSDTYWVDMLRDWILEHCTSTQEIVLVPDIRFPNEVAMIRKLGGVVIKVRRPIKLAVKDVHPSETALDEFHEWDIIIHNAAELTYLEQSVHSWFTAFIARTWEKSQ